jgi:hypothetical protein
MGVLLLPFVLLLCQYDDELAGGQKAKAMRPYRGNRTRLENQQYSPRDLRRVLWGCAAFICVVAIWAYWSQRGPETHDEAHRWLLQHYGSKPINDSNSHCVRNQEDGKTADWLHMKACFQRLYGAKGS